MNKSPMPAAIVWYRREDYPAILAIMADRQNLSPTYDEWLRRAEQSVKDIEARGYCAMKVHLDPAEFAEYCRAHMLHIDAAARSQYVNSIARKRMAGG